MSRRLAHKPQDTLVFGGFSREEEPTVVPMERKSIQVSQAPGGLDHISMNTPMHPQMSHTSVRVHHAPGGSSSGMNAVMGGDDTSMSSTNTPYSARSISEIGMRDNDYHPSVRVQRAPGGSSSGMSAVMGAEDPDVFQSEYRPSNIAAGFRENFDDVNVPNNLTHYAPGGKNSMESDIFSDASSMDNGGSFRTGRANVSHDVLSQDARKTMVEHVPHVGPAHQESTSNVLAPTPNTKRSGFRTARSNSSTLSFGADEPAERPSVRVHRHAPSVNIISWQ